MSEMKPVHYFKKIRFGLAIIGWLIWYIILGMFDYATKLKPAAPASTARRKTRPPHRVPLWALVLLAGQRSRSLDKDFSNDC